MLFWKFVNILGGRYLIINIFLLSILFTYITIKIKNNRIRFIFSLFFAFITLLQLTSLYTLREFIGYEFYIHFNVSDILRMAYFWYTEIVIFFLSIIMLDDWMLRLSAIIGWERKNKNNNNKNLFFIYL